MPRREKDFSSDVVIRALLWSSRHCCLCGKTCSTGIEVAHIDRNGPGTMDNAIPLCFDCHERTGSYDPNHPRGRRYRPKELRARREQVYEQHTSHLVPPISYGLRRSERTLPDVGFQMQHLGGPHWARARVWVSLAQGKLNYGPPRGSNHYSGVHLWNLNPGFGVNGHFPLPQGALQRLSSKREFIRARVDVTVIDIYERSHDLLPLGYVLTSPEAEWYLEPSDEELDIRAPKNRRQQ